MKGLAVLSSHARAEALRRSIDESIVRVVAEAPQQVWRYAPGWKFAKRRCPSHPTSACTLSL